MSYFIKNLHIRDFKIFKNIEIPFKQLTVLAGANSVGKSTVIQSLLLSRAAIDYKKKPDYYDLQLGNIPKIPINDIYLMQLGYNKRITDSNSIHFDYIFEDEYPSTWNIPRYNIEFKANPSENFLELIKNGDITTDTNIAFWAQPLHYLHAERIGPRPFYETKKERYLTTGFQGEYTIDLLTNSQLFDTLESKNFHKNTNTEGESINTLSQQTELWMNFIIPDIEISTNKIAEINRAVALFNNHTAPNVGFGISYVLPIIVSGLIANERTTFIVENPEAHLHPYGQSKIGQFLAMVAASGVQVIIETHSEHVINGIRLASATNMIDTKGIQINFFKKEDDEVKVVPISINEASDLSQFPKGFFDQVQRDAMEMLRIKKNKNLL